MEGGNLKLSIALGQKPTIIQKGPFYLMKQEAIPASEVTGATNLMASKGLEHSYIKLTSKNFIKISCYSSCGCLVGEPAALLIQDSSIACFL